MNDDKYFYISLGIVIFTLLLAMVYVWYTCDYYALRRVGALIVAYSVVCAYISHTATSNSRMYDAKPLGGENNDPLGRKAEETSMDLRAIIRNGLQTSAQRFFALHVGTGFFGEILHGFGDLIAKAVF